MELINIIKSILFIFWFMFSNNLFKQHKVTEVNRLLRLFRNLTILYIIGMCIEFYFGLNFMHDLVFDVNVIKLIK